VSFQVIRNGLFAAVVCLGVSLNAPSAMAKGTTIYSPRDNPALVAAIAQAIKTLPIFWAHFDKRPTPNEGFFLKVAMPTSHHDLEYCWVEIVERKSGKIVGVMSNEPEYDVGVKLGDKLIVQPDRVIDWAYIKHGKSFGHFTTRVLISKASKTERAEALAVFAPTPLEPEAH
jgi:uncharacterized protein YegJ (DUF2314 family)